MNDERTIEEKRKDPEYLLDLLRRVDDRVRECCGCIKYDLDGLADELDPILDKKS